MSTLKEAMQYAHTTHGHTRDEAVLSTPTQGLHTFAHQLHTHTYSHTHTHTYTHTYTTAHKIRLVERQPRQYPQRGY